MMDTTAFEKVVVRALMILLMIITSVATAWLFVLFVMNMWDALSAVRTALDLQEAVLRGLGGVFVVLIGLELLETLKSHGRHHRTRLEVILVVSAIAVARHVIQVDFHEVTGTFLGGLGVLVAALVAGFYLLQRAPQSAGGTENA